MVIRLQGLHSTECKLLSMAVHLHWCYCSSVCEIMAIFIWSRTRHIYHVYFLLVLISNKMKYFNILSIFTTEVALKMPPLWMFLIAVWTIPILGSLDKMSIPEIAFQPVRKWVSCISQHFASRSFTLFSRKLYVARLQNWFCPCKHIQMKRCTYTRTSFADVRINKTYFMS